MSANFWAGLGAIATAVAAIATGVVVFLNYMYLARFNRSLELQHLSVEIQHKTAQGQLLLQINHEFFYQQPHKKIIENLENKRSLREVGITDTELDDHVGILDTIGTFLKEGILDNKDWVWALFSHYVMSAYESKEISDYVRSCQEGSPTFV